MLHFNFIHMAYFQRIIFISILIINMHSLVAQDFDVYPRLKDDNVKIPDLYERVTLEEFQILSRDIRMMDMPYSLIVPGYIHFKAKDYSVGYTILGVRLLGFAGLAVNGIRMSQMGTRAVDIIEGTDNLKADRNLFFASSTLILSSWLFDWIHGKSRLEKKQELIRYKYAIKFRLENSYKKQSVLNDSPTIMFTLKF